MMRIESKATHMFCSHNNKNSMSKSHPPSRNSAARKDTPSSHGGLTFDSPRGDPWLRDS